MSENKSIVIVDDHTLFRKGLIAIIGSSNGFEVTGEAGTAAEGMQVAQELLPEMMIIDITLPDKNGIKLTREVRRHFPDIKIMIVSMHSKIDYITEAFKAGALSYVLKDSATENLMLGLQSMSKGLYHIDSSIAPEVVSRLKGLATREENNFNAAYDKLTTREQQVFRLLVEGTPVKELAEILYISPKTVENHRGSIMKKLDIHSTVELIRYAVQIGLIEQETAVS